MRPVGMPHADIDEIPRHADLRHGLATHRPNLVHYEQFEVGVDVLHSPVSQQQAILMFEVSASLGCAIHDLLYEGPVVGMYALHH